MHDEAIQIRQPTGDTETLRAFIRPVSTAFADDYTDEMFQMDRQLWEVDRLIGAVDGETWVGAAGALSMRLTVPGGEVRAAGLTDVGVAPSHRRRGILTRMMRWLLDQATERAEPVAILYASDGAIYPNFGFGMGTLRGTFEIDRHAFRFARPAEPLGRVRLVDVDEGMRLIPALFERLRTERVGEVSRHPDRWRLQLLADDGRMRPGLGMKSNAVLEVDGQLRRYAIYRVKSEWDERGAKNTLTVLELSGLDPAAERALWEWLAGIDLVAKIQAWRTSVPSPLFLQMATPRRLGLTIADGMWIRLIDLQAALEARTYAAGGTVTLEVTDAFCPANEGRWTLDVASDRGMASVSAATTAVEADVALDTTDLATVYLGTFSFADLARAGRLAELRPGGVAAADLLFRTAEAPHSATMF